MDNAKYNKVFGIGFHRTGTTTLDNAFEILGFSNWWFRTRGNPQLNAIIEEFKYENYTTIRSIINTHQAFTDNPFFFPQFYQWLDREYPCSRFILTERNSTNWFNSCQRYLSGKRQTHPTYPIIYGQQGNCDRSNWIEVYETHNYNAKQYFGDRLLVVNWESGDGWDKLCSFLDCPIPDRDFPHLNSSIIDAKELG